ncbi:DUF4365 domain-containing protein [Bittarella massiliensis (ex Durand et al. 2017)]|uniref:DUF4365 domain-containing protein n=1 Tax=Bittarella massiliensis (ex Durand et al. 2017) TaxID=1720313 RepID=UPI0009EB539A|nr:DUF4365 domain-containing protein [Bittarella massiliensis (ex Durand et al. 2017)]
MPITIQHQKEALSQAYVRAVIAKAGFNFGKSEFDYGIDGTIKDVINRGGRYCESCFGINFQLKSSCNVSFQDGKVVYDLESKNYNDLISESSMLPNILILLVFPENSDEWLDVSADQLVLKKCAWWCSLEGQEPTINRATKRISIPDCQIFSSAALVDLMEKVKGGEKL